MALPLNSMRPDWFDAPRLSLLSTLTARTFSTESFLQMHSNFDSLQVLVRRSQLEKLIEKRAEENSRLEKVCHLALIFKFLPRFPQIFEENCAHFFKLIDDIDVFSIRYVTRRASPGMRSGGAFPT